EVGSPVRLRGVRIGQVSRITFVNEVYKTDLRYVLVRVSMPLDKGDVEREMASTLQKEVENGLRVRLTSQGLTGTSYLEADYLDAARYPALPITWKPACLYVPSASSVITVLSDSLEKIFGQLEGAHIQEVMTDLDRLIITINNLVTNELTPTIAGIGAASTESSKALKDMRQTWKTAMEEKITPILENTREASASLPDTMLRLNQAVQRLDILVADQQRNVSDTMSNLRGVSQNLKDITESAREYPSSMLFGEPPPKVDLKK
ncbi:MAG: MlaD family protein, partial [Lentisphaerota bacterium]